MNWYMIGGAVVLALIVFGTWFYSKNSNLMANSDVNAQVAAAAAQGLKLEDVTVGAGDEAQTGQTVAVHYVGKLQDGTVFDSSVARGTPFTFTLGTGQVIKGWDQGVAGMRVGGVRKLEIPPELGYGDRDLGAIPPNSTLFFDVELLGVVDSKG